MNARVSIASIVLAMLVPVAGATASAAVPVQCRDKALKALDASLVRYDKALAAGTIDAVERAVCEDEVVAKAVSLRKQLTSADLTAKACAALTGALTTLDGLVSKVVPGPTPATECRAQRLQELDDVLARYELGLAAGTLDKKEQAASASDVLERGITVRNTLRNLDVTLARCQQAQPTIQTMAKLVSKRAGGQGASTAGAPLVATCRVAFDSHVTTFTAQSYVSYATGDSSLYASADGLQTVRRSASAYKTSSLTRLVELVADGERIVASVDAAATRSAPLTLAYATVGATAATPRALPRVQEAWGAFDVSPQSNGSVAIRLRRNGTVVRLAPAFWGANAIELLLGVTAKPATASGECVVAPAK